MVDSDLAKELNLLHGSRSFILKHPPNEPTVVIQLELIPADGCMYSVAGESILPNGRRVPSVFVIEDGGGNLLKVYWRIDGSWFEPSDSEVQQQIGAPHSDIFPFDWSYSIPVENDIYH